MIQYDFDIKRLIQVFIPQYRNSNLILFLESLLEPIRQIKEEFLIFINKQKQELTRNGQVGNLEIILNDVFDSERRRIRIEDGVRQGFKFPSVKEIGFDFTEGFEFPKAVVEDCDFLVYIPSDFNQSEGFEFPKETGFDFRDGIDMSEGFEFPKETGFDFTEDFEFPKIDNTVVSQVEFIIKAYKIIGKTFKVVVE